MKQLFTDTYSLLHIARGIKARQEVVDVDGSVEDADAAFKAAALMKYTPEVAITSLEDHPNLTDLLIILLGRENNLRELLKKKSKDREKLVKLAAERDRVWEKYEVMRRIMCFDATCLIVEKIEI